MFLLGEGTSVSFQYCQYFAELRMMLININNSDSISYHLLSTFHVLIKGIGHFTNIPRSGTTSFIHCYIPILGTVTVMWKAVNKCLHTHLKTLRVWFPAQCSKGNISLCLYLVYVKLMFILSIKCALAFCY